MFRREFLYGVPALALVLGGGDSLAAPAKRPSANGGDPGPFNVRRFGAVGDGVHDDSPAIQKALDAVPAGGGTVFVPPGVYRLGQTVHFRRDSTRLIGAGMNATTLRAAPTANFLVCLEIAKLNGCVMSELTVDANWSERVNNLKFGRTSAVSIVEASDSIIQFVRVTGACGVAKGESSPGLAIGRARGVDTGRNVIAFCQAIKNGTSERLSDGFFTSGFSNVIIGSTAIDCSDTGFVLESSSYSRIAGCSARSCSSGAAVSNFFADSGIGNTIEDVTIHDWNATVTGGMSVQGDTDAPLVDTMIANVTLTFVKGEGPAIYAWSRSGGRSIRGLSITDSRIRGAHTQGILLWGVEDGRISGCDIDGTNDPCIDIRENCENIFITNNRLTPAGSFALISSKSEDIVVTGNYVRGNPAKTTFPMYFYAGTKVTVGGNILRGYSIAATGNDQGVEIAKV